MRTAHCYCRPHCSNGPVRAAPSSASGHGPQGTCTRWWLRYVVVNLSMWKPDSNLIIILSRASACTEDMLSCSCRQSAHFLCSQSVLFERSLWRPSYHKLMRSPSNGLWHTHKHTVGINTHGYVARRQADVHTQTRTGPSFLSLPLFPPPLSLSFMRTHLHSCSARGEL